jgi:phospholipid/cholesterol/gamma-HCH transport system ATP-binding protein
MPETTMAKGHEPQLAFQDVSLVIDDVTLLKNISFELHRGQTLIVLGAAGSGKTLLLKLCLGLFRPTSGRVIIFGEDATELSEKRWFDIRSRIGVLFQEGGLFDSMNIADNVAYPLRNQPLLRCPEEEIDSRVLQSLQFVELGATLEKFPSELSGGMRRRAGIARAMVTNPELLLYDSPTAGLDPITANTIVALITKGRDTSGATTVMVTQRGQDGQILARFRYDPALQGLVPADGDRAAAGTRYLVLENGSTVFLGTSADLGSTANAYVSTFVPHG